MAFAVETIAAGGGAFFKPGDHANDVAILVEVKRFQSQCPGNFGPKDRITADLTIFKDAAALTGGTPDLIPGAIIENTILARDLEALVGKATIVTLAQVKSKTPGNHPAWVWRPVDAPVQEQVVAYATKREEVLAAAMDAAPDFG